ncbi:hypothetical protein JCGZ_05345 [Jatropha curcas]|uniref:Uncharacterized protein n=1 Tax=Jatropha curcas TaxID=180498 RepID=A0A067KNV1_JATCU|nr:hypothetical protein JCGZ_05345 [Jatropha curcas]
MATLRLSAYDEDTLELFINHIAVLGDAGNALMFLYGSAITHPWSSRKQGAQLGKPLVLPSGPITRSRAKRYGAVLSLYFQEQVTQELHDLAFNKCYVKLEGTPKFLTLLKACVEDGSTAVLSSTPCRC